MKPCTVKYGKKSDFPITISIPVPNGGSTFVRVYLDNKSYMEFTEEFNKRNTENTTRNNNTENNAEKTEEAKEANETNEASQTESAEEV